MFCESNNNRRAILYKTANGKLFQMQQTEHSDYEQYVTNSYPHVCHVGQRTSTHAWPIDPLSALSSGYYARQERYVMPGVCLSAC